MKHLPIAVALLALTTGNAFAQGHFVHGTIKKIDSAAKTVAVATAGGAEEVIHFTDKTVVHPTAAASKDAWAGLKEGTEVAVHYTGAATKKTAVEVDNLAKDGLKAAEGAVVSVDKATKKCVVKSADGVDHAFDMTGHAAADAGKATAEGVTKGAKVTVYYTEEAGKKVAHFFKR